MKTFSAISRLLCFSFLVASALSAFAAPHDFNATPGYGVFNSVAKNPFFEVDIVSVTLAAETTELDGRKRLAFNFTVRNVGGGYQEEVVVFLNDFTTLPWPVTLVAGGYAEAGDLAPGTPSVPTVASTFSALTFIVDAANAEAAKTAILAQQHLHVTCKELYRFSIPIFEADAAMDTAFVDGTQAGNIRTITFANSTPSLAALQPECLLVHNPNVFMLREADPFNGEEVLRFHLTNVETADGDYATTKVKTKVLKVTSVVTNPMTNSVTVTGTEVNVWDVITSGLSSSTQHDGFRGFASRDPWNPPSGTSFHTAAERALRAYSPAEDPDNTSTGFPPPSVADLQGLFAMHYPINDLQIAPGVMLDGEFLFRGLDTDVDVVVRGTAAKVAVKLTNHVEMTFRLTAEAGVNLVDTERTLLQTPLPPVVIPVLQVPVTIQPLLFVKAGASANAQSRIQVPFHSAMTAGYVMKFDGEKPVGSQISFDPYYKATPLKTSKPSLARAVHMDASIWAEAGLDILIENTIGPGISVRATGDLQVRPLADPWWTVDADVALNGRFNFSILGFNIVSSQAPLFTSPPLFNINAGGPHVPTSLTGPLDKEEGGHLRWGRAAKWTTSQPTGGNACRVRGTAEDAFAVFNASTPATTLMRLNAKGERLWSHSLGEQLQHVVGTTDGGVILIGCNAGAPGVRLFKYDGNGNRLWEKHQLFDHSDTHAPQLHVTRALIRDTGTGAQEMHIVGWRLRNQTSRHVDGFLIRCDDAGNVLGTVSFDSPDYTTVRDAAYTPDGGIVFCGMNQPSPDGTAYPGPGVITAGWLMKTDLLGDIQWNRAVTSYRGNEFRSVAVAPTGEIYTCGFLTTVVGNLYGSMQVTRHNADGDLISAQTLGESSDTPTVDDYALLPTSGSAAQIYDTNPTNTVSTNFPNWLPDSGKTIWDEGRRVVWSDNGLIVTSTTGLSTSRAATVACLTENLAVRWFTVHERQNSEEYLFDIIPTADGLLAVGSSEQFLGFKTGSTSSFTNQSALVLKLPMDGKCDLHPGTQGIHKFLQPGMHDHLNNEQELQPPYSPDYQPSITGQVTLTQANVPGTTSPGAALFPFQFTEPTFTHWAPLEAGDANTAMTFPQWADYWNLPTNSQTADADNDGRSNGQEWFFGGDPSTTEQGPPSLGISLTSGNLTFNTTRSNAAAGVAPVFETSTTLTSWGPLATGSISSSPLNAFTDWLTFTIPITSEPRRFYRVAAP